MSSSFPKSLRSTKITNKAYLMAKHANNDSGKEYSNQYKYNIIKRISQSRILASIAVPVS